jgi:hypothetical protein
MREFEEAGSSAGRIFPVPMPDRQTDLDLASMRLEEAPPPPVPSVDVVPIVAPDGRGQTAESTEIEVLPQASPKEPLFALVDQQGDSALPPSAKVKKVFDVGAALDRLDVDPALVEEVARAAEALRPLGALTLARPPDEQERAQLEGRGAYHTDIPIGETEVTVYVKGTGNEAAFEQGEGVFTGYPSQADGLFFDDLTLSTHPRMLGTETVRWGLMEAINASCVFAHMAQREGWQKLEDAVRAGVTIPLNVLHQKELSAYLGDLLAQRITGGVHTFDADGLSWVGNESLGTVSMIVPSSERLISDSGDSTEAASARIRDPEVAEVTARSLRTLLEIGFCYSAASAHGQNVYTTGLVAQADSSDLVALGDYRGSRMACAGDWDAPIYRYASAEDQRRVLLFDQLESDSFLIPQHAPLIGKTLRATWEQTLDTQQVFWRELLQDAADPIALEKMLHYLPFARTEFSAAVATLLVRTHNPQQWEDMADTKRQILAQYEDQYGVLSEYNAKVKANLRENDSLPYDFSELIRTGKLRARPVLDFLRTGNESFLRTDPIFGRAIELAEAIEAVPNSAVRDELLRLCAFNFDRKDLLVLRVRPDLTTEFEGKHYTLLRSLIQTGRIDDAKYVLETLAMTTREGIAGSASIERDAEVNRHKFPRLLLEENASYKDIYEDAKLERYVYKLGQWANTGGMGLGELFRRKTQKGGSAAKSYSMYQAAERMGMPPPLSIVMAVLCSPTIGTTDRSRIADWAKQYVGKALRMEFDTHNPKELAALFDELDTMTAAVASQYPELAFAHNSHAAGIFAASNPARAEAYFKAAMQYYSVDIKQRSHLATLEVGQWDNYDWVTDPRLMHLIAERYDELGLPQVAGQYRNTHLPGRSYWA